MPVGVGVAVPVGVGVGDTATVTRHSNWYHGVLGLVTLSFATLLIIVFVISHEADIIATPTETLKNIVLPSETRPGFPALDKIKKPA